MWLVIHGRTIAYNLFYFKKLRNKQLWVNLFIIIFINEITTFEHVSHCHGNKTALRMSLFNIFGGKVKLCSNKKLAYSSDICVVP